MGRSALAVVAGALVLAATGPGCSSSPSGPIDASGMTPQKHDALFPISAGTHAVDAMPGPDKCANCHVDPETFTKFSCVTCHDAHGQNLTDAAHLGVVPGYAYGEETCYACHPSGEAKGFDHEANFPIAAGTIHQNIRCGTCHVDPSDRKKVDCTSCHTREKTDPRHAAVPDYVWDSPKCLACHPKSDVPLPANHPFPIGTGTKHAGIGCETCHVDPSNRKTFDCISCHTHEQTKTDATHAAVPGYQYASASCYACHPTANVTGLVDHSAFFPIGPNDKHAGISCATCHVDPNDRKVFDCISCHTHEKTGTDLNHNGIPNYQYASASCYQCHPKADVVGLINHTFFPISAGTTHAGVACSKCHTVPGDKTSVNCGTCHLAAATLTQHTKTGASVGGYQFMPSLCIRCHADGQVDRIAMHLPFTIKSGSKHYKESCLSCHPAFRTDKSWAADFATPKLACSPCHSKSSMDNKHQGFAGYSYTPTSCIQSGCHAAGRTP